MKIGAIVPQGWVGEYDGWEPLDAWRRVLDLNLTGAFVCAQRAARIMVASGTAGRIVNITSVHEHIPLREQAAYCAAKGGLGLLTKAMALELGEHGITVNAIAPGEIATPLTGAGDEDPSALERPALPAGRQRTRPRQHPARVASLEGAVATQGPASILLAEPIPLAALAIQEVG